jgi:hypothetical protein
MIRVLIPVRGQETISDIKEYNLEFEHMKRELPKFSGNAFLIDILNADGNDVKYLTDISFGFLPHDDPEYLQISAKNEKIFGFTHACTLTINMTIENVYYDVDNYSYFIDSYLRKLLLILNLSYATPISFLKSLIQKDKEDIGISQYVMNSIDFAYIHIEKIEWPSVISPKLQKTLNWLRKFEINLHSSSKSPAGRAINAFSHIFSYELFETDSAKLFWCLLGIEALFASNNNGIMEQIRQRIQIVFGEPKEFKRKINKLYEFRSRLIHGDLDFPAKFSEDVDNYEYEYWDYVSFATSLLMSSIKTLIINDTDRFEFELVWRNKLEENIN